MKLFSIKRKELEDTSFFGENVCFSQRKSFCKQQQIVHLLIPWHLYASVWYTNNFVSFSFFCSYFPPVYGGAPPNGEYSLVSVEKEVGLRLFE